MYPYPREGRIMKDLVNSLLTIVQSVIHIEKCLGEMYRLNATAKSYNLSEDISGKFLCYEHLHWVSCMITT